MTAVRFVRVACKVAKDHYITTVSINANVQSMLGNIYKTNIIGLGGYLSTVSSITASKRTKGCKQPLILKKTILIPKGGHV